MRINCAKALPITKKPVKPDDEYDAGTQVGAAPNLVGRSSAIRAGPSDGPLFRAIWVNAVKRFQTATGLASNGQLDCRNIRRAEYSALVRVTQLQPALERWRGCRINLRGLPSS